MSDDLTKIPEAPRVLGPASSRNMQLFDPLRQALFLQALRQSPIVGAAARAAGVDLETAYRMRRRNPQFAAAWDGALTAAVDDLEQVAVKRARDGSDTLLMQLLRAHRPERYREKLDVSVARRAEIIVDLVPAAAVAAVEPDDIDAELLTEGQKDR